MIEGKTTSGFEFVIDEEKIDDMEFVELIAKSDKDITLLPDLMNRLLGEDQKNRLYDHLKEKHGRASLKATSDALEEIFGAASEKVKNLFDSPA